MGNLGSISRRNLRGAQDPSAPKWLRAVYLLTFVLLPCMVITSLLVTWAILTHQPAFR